MTRPTHSCTRRTTYLTGLSGSASIRRTSFTLRTTGQVEPGAQSAGYQKRIGQTLYDAASMTAMSSELEWQGAKQAVVSLTDPVFCPFHSHQVRLHPVSKSLPVPSIDSSFCVPIIVV